jgi:ligand-binding SRPBCC domain-containing protein
VEITDCVTYELPFGPVGRMAQFLFVRRQLEAIFDYREQAVRRLLGV